MASKKKEYTEIISETANGDVRIPVKMNLGIMCQLTGNSATIQDVYVSVWQRNERMIKVFTRYIDCLLKDKTITITGDIKALVRSGEVIAYNLKAEQVDGLADYLRNQISDFNPNGYATLEVKYEEMFVNLQESRQQQVMEQLARDDDEDEDEEDTTDPN